MIEGDSCLEAWLLQTLGAETEGDTRHMKQKFKAHTGVEAHEPEWMERRLNRNVLDQARGRVRNLRI